MHSMTEHSASSPAPLTANLPAAASILAIEQENYRTRTFTLDMRLAAVPGQFAMIWLPGFDEKPFSLVSANPVRIMVTNVGPFTQLVHEKKVGDLLWVRGPFGHGFCPQPDDKNLLLVGGGYGVAPLLWLAEFMANAEIRVTTIIGARGESDLLYVNRFAALAEQSALAEHSASSTYDLQVTTDDGSTGTRGLVTDVAEPLLAGGEVDHVFACGPHTMLTALRALAALHRVPCQLSWEEYMRCGMGLCGSCEFDGALLCLDGPVVAVET
jgi:dihydroorotate dehydrogenase electron transfer subunit